MIYRHYYLILFILLHLGCLAQQQKDVKAGVITLANNNMMGFTNLTLSEDEVIFTNVATKGQVSYPLTEVRRIDDDNQKIIYTGKLADMPKPVAVENDTLYRPNYPAGIYKTKEDFIAKKPTSKEFVLPVGPTGSYQENVEHNCFFLVDDGEKLKKAFAVSYKGHLYFKVDAILSNRNKKDRAQTGSAPHQFVRVILGGDNYFYTEADLANLWAQGLAYGAVGGTAGHILAKSELHGKGVVWDFKNGEFNIFKNCKDYNAFIAPLNPEAVQECGERQPDLYQVRQAMEKIK